MPELNTHPAYPLSTLRWVPRDTQRKTRGRADRYSFLVRNFHPLLHAGLSRRTVIPVRLTSTTRPANTRLASPNADSKSKPRNHSSCALDFAGHARSTNRRQMQTIGRASRFTGRYLAFMVRPLRRCVKRSEVTSHFSTDVMEFRSVIRTLPGISGISFILRNYSLFGTVRDR